MPLVSRSRQKAEEEGKSGSGRNPFSIPVFVVVSVAGRSGSPRIQSHDRGSLHTKSRR